MQKVGWTKIQFFGYTGQLRQTTNPTIRAGGCLSRSFSASPMGNENISRRLKEAEGEKINITALKAILKKEK